MDDHKRRRVKTAPPFKFAITISGGRHPQIWLAAVLQPAELRPKDVEII